jgi:hypothetical protein
VGGGPRREAVVANAQRLRHDAAPSVAWSDTYNKPGFVAEIRDGRLWVFREGSPEHEEFKKFGELTKSVTRIGAGPNGMTIRAADVQTLDDYIKAK